MTEKLDFDMEGYPTGLEDWMRKQGASVCIYTIRPGEIVFSLGPGPGELDEACHTYFHQRRMEDWHSGRFLSICDAGPEDESTFDRLKRTIIEEYKEEQNEQRLWVRLKSEIDMIIDSIKSEIDWRIFLWRRPWDK